jgi:hypothetical protein
MRQKLKDIFATIEPGDNDWSWRSQFLWLEKNRAAQLCDLTWSMFRQGQKEPILIGDDERLWDGHHRLYVAYGLGWDEIETIS